MGEASNAYPIEDFVEWMFGYSHNNADVDSLKKNKLTCENNKGLFFPINEEVINTSTDIMWKMWREFCFKGDENSLDTPLK